MKLALLAVCIGAFFAVTGIAAGHVLRDQENQLAAETAQGKLTGSATVGGGLFAIVNTVVDGGTSYVGKENDRSGNCDGDSGTVGFNGGPTDNVVCAHFVQHSGCCNAGSPKMRFAFESHPAPGFSVFYIVRITDNGVSDNYAYTGVLSFAEARSFVNMGAIGSGHAFDNWAFQTPSNSTYTVTP